VYEMAGTLRISMQEVKKGKRAKGSLEGCPWEDDPSLLEDRYPDP
jgi:hypothetical protein